MSLRVVLYAEGGGESTGSITEVPRPGAPLDDDEMGAGHSLTRRCIAAKRRIPEAAIRFEAPLRTERGHVARGSSLKNRTVLRQLLTWANPTRRPELVVVLVDADKASGPAIRAELLRHVQDLPIPKVIGVACPEFEAWLIADVKSVADALGVDQLVTPPSPESLPPGEPRRIWDSWLAQSPHPAEQDPKTREKSLRIEVARRCDLAIVQQTCESFAAFSASFRPDA